MRRLGLGLVDRVWGLRVGVGEGRVKRRRTEVVANVPSNNWSIPNRSFGSSSNTWSNPKPYPTNKKEEIKDE